jgi:RNA binding exosome subunit
MKYIHHIYLSVFVKEFEDINFVRNIMKEFLPETKDENNPLINEERVSIDDEHAMIILRAKISKSKDTKEFISLIKKSLSEEDVQRLISEENRVDEEGNFYFRLDKEKALNGSYELTDSGNCFHFKIQIASYPKNRENAIKIVKKIFSTEKNI